LDLREQHGGIVKRKIDDTPKEAVEEVQSAEATDRHAESEFEDVAELYCEVIEEADDALKAFTREDLDYLAEKIAMRLGDQFLGQFAERISKQLVESAVERVLMRLSSAETDAESLD
jgi:hypothetical protein